MSYDIPSQQGRTVVITGANTGIGRITAVKLAAAGAFVVVCARSAERSREVLDEIGAHNCAFVPLDLGDFDSVRSAAAQVLALNRPIHMLINNAGLAGVRGLTKSGFEIAFGTNHLGHFLFTQLLIDRMLSSTPSRIVNVASRAHYDTRGIDFSILQRTTSTRTGLPEYAVSKLANVLHVRELTARYRDQGLTSYSLHPGVVATEIWRSLPRIIERLVTQFMITPEQGAETTLYCATASELNGVSGGYYDKCKLKRESGAAQNDALAAELWKRSEAWVR